MGVLIDMTNYKIDSLVFNEFLPEMFRRVGMNGSEINDFTKIPNWFQTKKWTKDDEDQFCIWLVQRLKYRLNLSSKAAEREARMFLLNFGWSTGEEKQLELNFENNQPT